MKPIKFVCADPYGADDITFSDMVEAIWEKGDTRMVAQIMFASPVPITPTCWGPGIPSTTIAHIVEKVFVEWKHEHEIEGVAIGIIGDEPHQIAIVGRTNQADQIGQSFAGRYFAGTVYGR